MRRSGWRGGTDLLDKAVDWMIQPALNGQPYNKPTFTQAHKQTNGHCTTSKQAHK